METTIAASGRSDVDRVATWILDIEKPTTTFESLSEPGNSFRTLDRKLATALTQTLTGELGRRVSIAKRDILNASGDKPKLLTGRQILFMIYSHFDTNKKHGTHVHNH